MEIGQEGLLVAYKTRNSSILDLILHVFPRLAFVKLSNFNNQPLLCIAARDGDFPAVKTILKHWKILELSQPHRPVLNTALCHASAGGFLLIVYSLLKSGADNVDDGFRGAVGYNRMKIAKLLLNKGANIHDSNNFALQQAVCSNYTNMARLLLDRGANANLYSYKKKSLLRLACKKGHLEMVCLLIEKGADLGQYGSDALLAAIQKGQFDLVCLLLEKGVDVQANQNAALQEAIWEDELEIAKLLVQKGARANLEMLRNLQRGLSEEEMQLLLSTLSDKEIEEYNNETVLCKQS